VTLGAYLSDERTAGMVTSYAAFAISARRTGLGIRAGSTSWCLLIRLCLRWGPCFSLIRVGDAYGSYLHNTVAVCSLRAASIDFVATQGRGQLSTAKGYERSAFRHIPAGTQLSGLGRLHLRLVVEVSL
jgi:hypothetical protein